MNKLKMAGVALAATMLIAFIGCASMQDAVVPCWIDPAVGEYTEESMTSFLPYTTLWDAKRLKRHMDYKYRINQEMFLRDRKDDIMLYGFIDDSIAIGMADAMEFKEAVFSPSSPIGALLPTLLGGTLGAVLISKPGDKKKIDALKNGGTNGTNGSTTNAIA
jgi:hypothetical protein